MFIEGNIKYSKKFEHQFLASRLHWWIVPTVIKATCECNCSITSFQYYSHSYVGTSGGHLITRTKEHKLVIAEKLQQKHLVIFYNGLFQWVQQKFKTLNTVLVFFFTQPALSRLHCSLSFTEYSCNITAYMHFILEVNMQGNSLKYTIW